MFIPRLTDDGMMGNKYWYDTNYNPYYPDYGLPNCTAYCYGRGWEVMQGNDPELPMGNAEEWADRTTYPVGSTPRLGSILCFAYADAGHVASVEIINEDGSIVVSNSAWQGTYFWIETLYPEDNYRPSWADNYDFRGFIYLPIPGPTPPTPTDFSKKKDSLVRRWCKHRCWA